MGRGGSPAMVAAQSAIAILSLLVSACSVTIILINKYNFVDVYAYTSGHNYSNSYSYYMVDCIIDPDSSGSNSCTYLYTLGSISIFVSAIMAFVQCFAVGSPPCLLVSDLVLALFSIGWWLAGGVVMTRKNHDLNNMDWGLKSYRTGVEAVAWIALGFSVIMLIVIFVAAYKGAYKPIPSQQQLAVQQGPDRPQSIAMMPLATAAPLYSQPPGPAPMGMYPTGAPPPGYPGAYQPYQPYPPAMYSGVVQEGGAAATAAPVMGIPVMGYPVGVPPTTTATVTGVPPSALPHQQNPGQPTQQLQ